MRVGFKGFTLLEMMLVLAIVSGGIYMGLRVWQQQILEQRIARTSIQMQQIMNAAASYYVLCNSWPASIATLQTVGVITCGNTLKDSTGFLPAGTIKSPWGGTTYNVVSTAKNFYIYATITQTTNVLANYYATILLGRLPLAYIANDVSATPPTNAPCTGTTCYVVAQIGIPPQNLNKALGVNFAGIYHHGACIPVPECKVDAKGTTMKAQVFVVPVSVSGLADKGIDSLTNVYPISSFTAYATANATLPVNCTGTTPSTPADSCGVGAISPTGKFWRACLDIVTVRGPVNGVNTSSISVNGGPFIKWGEKVSLAAFTRCAPATEPMSGSDFSVFSN